MTIEQRLEQVEQQNQRIQRTNKRLTVALTMTVVGDVRGGDDGGDGREGRCVRYGEGAAYLGDE
jgi:hypothetical protein